LLAFSWQEQLLLPSHFLLLFALFFQEKAHNGRAPGCRKLRAPEPSLRAGTLIPGKLGNRSFAEFNSSMGRYFYNNKDRAEDNDVRDKILN